MLATSDVVGARESQDKAQAAFGVGAFLFYVVAVALDPPTSLGSMTGPELVAHLEDGRYLGFGSFLSVAASALCWLWFLGFMRARLTGRAPEHLVSTFFGSGVAFVALLLVGRAADGAPAAIYGFGFQGAELDPVAASLFIYLGYDTWALAGVAAGACAGALSAACRSTDLLPRWFTRLGYGAAAAGVLAFVFSPFALALVLAWVAGAAVASARTARPETPGL